MLGNFPLEGIDPSDERLLDYVAQVAPALIADGLWSREKALSVVSFLVWQRPEAAGTERLLERLAERYPEEPDWPFYLAEMYRLRGDRDRAEAAYRQALAVEPGYAVAYLRLGAVAETEAQGLTLQIPNSKLQTPNPKAKEQWEAAAGWYARLYEAVPDDRLVLKRLAGVCAALEEAGGEDVVCREAAERAIVGRGDKGARGHGEEEGGPLPSWLAAADSPAAVLWAGWLAQVAGVEPQYRVDQQLDTGWTLLGYDVDEARLVRGEPVDLLLYWVGPASAEAGSEQDGWYRAGERWVQVLEGVQNMVPNGGFELGAEDGSPAGFPGDIYRADPGTRRLVTDVRGGQRGTVALLDNTEVYSKTSFVSTWLPVIPDGLYLQAGWVKSVGGRGNLGRRWTGNLEIEEGVRPYSYVAAGVSVDEWQHYAGLTRPLEGATGCHIWQINYMTVGQVYFDDVFFLEVGSPGE